MIPSFERVMWSCPVHPHGTNSKRNARRSILQHCDTESLLALRLVSRNMCEWAKREESRCFRDIRLTLRLTEESPIAPGNWDALQRIGHLGQRVIFTLVVTSRDKMLEFEDNGAARTPTLNPLPNERRWDSRGKYSLIELPVPVLGGVFSALDVGEDEPDGLFKRVLDLTPNMQSLCIRDQVLWEGAPRAEIGADWGRTLVDEALIYLRCQLEESLSARFVELDRLGQLCRHEEASRRRELAELEALAALEELSLLEECLVAEFGKLPGLDPAAQSERLACIKEEANRNKLTRLDRLFQLEESLMAQRGEVARLKAQVRLPKLLEMQVGSPLALWHFRTSAGYGNGGGQVPGAGTWATIKTLNITLPTITPGLTRGRKRTVKKAVYTFLAEFAETVETLAIGFAIPPSGRAPATAETGNPLVYDLDPEFGGGGEIAMYPALKKLGLKNMRLAWEGGLKEFLTERAPACVDLVLVGCGFASQQACKGLYGLFELQNAEKLCHAGVPLLLTRKLRLPVD